MSHDPVRLRDDPEVPASVRAALRWAAERPAAAQQIARDLAFFGATLGTSAPPASRATTFLRRWVTHKVVWWATSALVLVGSVAAVLRAGAPSSASHTATMPAPAHRAAPAEGPAVRPASPAVEGVNLVEAHSSPPQAAPSPASAPSRGRTAARETAARTSLPPERLRAEMQNLARARHVLATDPASALALAEAGQREFSDGLFGEEREAIEVLALARLGRHREAAARGRRFLARHPRGPLSEQVRAAIASDPSSGGAPR